MFTREITDFNKQFAFEPVIENPRPSKQHSRVIVLGMGGSHLGADLMQAFFIDKEKDIYIHSSYGLPNMPEQELRRSIIVASSYSGNTEETIDGYTQAIDKGLDTIAIGVGGKLLALAKEKKLPYIILPDTGIQPRMASAFSLRAILKATDNEDGLRKTRVLADDLDPRAFEAEGKRLASVLKGKVSVVYASTKNKAVAYNWKIKLNETGKIPAFFNIVPELNHNEMNAFDIAPGTKHLSENIAFIMLTDATDDPRIKKRMDVLAKLYRDRNLIVHEVPIAGKTEFHAFFSSVLTADWLAYYTATEYDVDPEQVPLVEEFKKLIA